jgi:integrase
MAAKNQFTKSDYLPYEELKRLLDKLHKDKKYIWELYVRVSFCTALRASDVLSLTWSDIINRSSLVKREQKTGKVRKIQFSQNTQDRFDELYMLMKRPNPAELIFFNRRTGKPFTIQYINRIIKSWKEKYRIKIGNFSTHTFRKTFGRYVYDKNQNKSEALVLLNSILRHTSIDVTKVYIGLRDEEIQSVYSSIKV